MIIDESKFIDELLELRYAHHKDIAQLEEIYSHLKERYSKLSESTDNRCVEEALECTGESIRSIEEALQKLYYVGTSLEKLIQCY